MKWRVQTEYIGEFKSKVMTAQEEREHLVGNALSLDEIILSCRQNPNKIHVLNFWASWVDSCLHMNEVFSALAAANPDFSFWDVDAEAVADLSLYFRIKAVPTFVLVKDGKEVGRVDGADAEKLELALMSLKQEAKSSALPLKDRLKKLISRHPFMIFIKGTPQMPRCGFTKQLLDLLTSELIEYDYFDILNDDEVRQGLKVFSDWPTYPQIYMNGELIGGLDIFRELVKTRQIDELLARQPAAQVTP